MKLACILAAALAALTALGSVAAATESRTLYRHKNWEVRVVAFDDARLKCVAQVDSGNATFGIWADGESPARLQFFDPDWQLGQGQADVIVKVDNRPKWDLLSANLNKNSVLFDLPNDRDGRRFLGEVRAGRTIRLGNARGREVGRWSLAGSSAALGALSNCVDLIKADRDANPFD